jgi:hypothetical protein
VLYLLSPQAPSWRVAGLLKNILKELNSVFFDTLLTPMEIFILYTLLRGFWLSQRDREASSSLSLHFMFTIALGDILRRVM